MEKPAGTSERESRDRSARTPGRPPSTADLLATFPERFQAGDLRVDELVAALGRRGVVGLFLVLTALQLLPWPYGLSHLLATLLIPVAAQIVIRRREVWLPRWLLRRRVRRARLVAVIEPLVSLLRRVESVVRPRIDFVATPGGERLGGITALVLAIALAVPVPMVSWLTGTALLILAVGMVESDGLAMLAGTGLGLVAVIVLLLSLFGAAHLGSVLLG